MKEAKTTTHPQPPSGGGGMSLVGRSWWVMRGSTWGRHDATGTRSPSVVAGSAAALLLTLQHTTHTLTRERRCSVDVYTRHVPARPRLVRRRRIRLPGFPRARTLPHVWRLSKHNLIGIFVLKLNVYKQILYYYWCYMYGCLSICAHLSIWKQK